MKPSKLRYLIGIDEAGRGPIAGPVAVGAFAFLDPSAPKLFRGVKESKQLTEAQREAWLERILDARESGEVDFCVTFRSEKIIDTRGLTYAIKTALEESLSVLVTDSLIGFDQCQVLLDGGLKAPAEFVNQKTIIRGDSKEKAIALASICAKVTRDRYMNEFALRHPEYGFECHKGYGTVRHYYALKKFGVLPIHRKSFL